MTRKKNSQYLSDRKGFLFQFTFFIIAGVVGATTPSVDPRLGGASIESSLSTSIGVAVEEDGAVAAAAAAAAGAAAAATTVAVAGCLGKWGEGS